MATLKSCSRKTDPYLISNLTAASCPHFALSNSIDADELGGSMTCTREDTRWEAPRVDNHAFNFICFDEHTQSSICFISFHLSVYQSNMILSIPADYAGPELCPLPALPLAQQPLISKNLVVMASSAF
ncbi:hypothetical protein Hypma_000464 [Hypsizygus marmoreus]|uniref:Uncharacterized protein n=1 Tax=Hypsizygus marmoreus TaxID=39966 RepID=A0A369JA89_HYPMA|nr:hypothetical protein Hypma_000464 [Hypsizygus marmoreus]